VSSGGKHDYGDPETRQRILEVTRELLVERGAGLRLHEVAARAGVSRQALYLHFGGRQGLILALVRHMDETLELAELLAHVYSAEDGRQLLERAMRLSTEFWAKVAPVATVLVASQEDDALRAAWRDRMAFRRGTFRRMAERLDELGELAPSWDVAAAADLLHAVTHFGSWRELTGELGWSDDHYVDAMSRLLGRALLAGWPYGGSTSGYAPIRMTQKRSSHRGDLHAKRGSREPQHHVPALDELSDYRPHLDLGVEEVQHPVEVAAVPGFEPTSQCLHVLSRHRPRSIPASHGRSTPLHAELATSTLPAARAKRAVNSGSNWVPAPAASSRNAAALSIAGR
jgi:AcrR family transcriptional regulator